jgi:succinate-semialdehyde dehydrogenase/glutarate-semialdehyde dehydrogenase
MSLVSINPFTGQQTKEFESLGPAQLQQALAQSVTAQREWLRQSVQARSKFAAALGHELLAARETLARIAATEMGKPITQGIAEIEKCAWACRYYAKNAADFLKDQTVSTEAKKSYVRFDPLGVVVTIMPWNFPFWQVVRSSVPALVAGNSVLLKHSSNVPQCALALQDFFEKAGFPKNVFTSLLIETDRVETLIADRRVRGVALTGSAETGRTVGALTGSNLKKTVFELGGSDAFIVLDDADLETCCQVAVKSRLQNAGQSCTSAKRFIVTKAVAETFITKLIENLRNVAIGDPLDPATELGPLARKDLLEKVESQVTQSVSAGAKVLFGGKRHGSSGYFFQPTVLTNVVKGMPAYDQEIFGPVASVILVDDADEALRVANDSAYGLGASIWTRDLRQAQKLAGELEAGIVTINGQTRSDPRLPFGGVKDSGYGRELGSFGIREFVNIKSVVVNPRQRG